MKINPQDQFEERFRKAAGHDEETFPQMEKVWDRVEAKLDQERLSTQKSMWKRWAIAASVLLVATVGYQIFNTNQTPAAQTVEVAVPEIMAPRPVPAVDSSPEIKPEASAILQRQVVEQTPVAAADALPAPVAGYESQEPEPPVMTQEVKSEEDEMATRIFSARGVMRVPAAAEAKKHDPLYVLDGKVSTRAEAEAVADPGTVVKLENPLYIINGQEYTEKEMFGPEPTSPYAPLDQQDIESISILQGKEATDAYGRKGRKGVVIITTKTGKPKPKKAP